jgi:hypothetical protein
LNFLEEKSQMVLDPTRKSSLSTAELSAFYQQIGGVKVFNTEQGVAGGKTFTIFKDSGDPDLTKKVAAVKEAIRLIDAKGVAIPTGLRVYCTNAYAAQNRAFHRDGQWNEVAMVILGPKAVTGGRADAMSGTNLGGCNPPTITCIHEIGHILHEHGAGDVFWETGSPLSGKAASAGEVSGYAGQNGKEFVAEVFAGKVLGKAFSAAVNNEYAGFGGPAVP